MSGPRAAAFLCKDRGLPPAKAIAHLQTTRHRSSGALWPSWSLAYSSNMTQLSYLPQAVNNLSLSG